jgi:hypothetical protein
VGELIDLQPGGHSSNYTQPKINRQRLSVRFAWKSQDQKNKSKRAFAIEMSNVKTRHCS